MKFFEKRKVLRRLKRLKRGDGLGRAASRWKGEARGLGRPASDALASIKRPSVGLFTVRGAEDARTAKRRAEARKLALAAAAVEAAGRRRRS